MNNDVGVGVRPVFSLRRVFLEYSSVYIKVLRLSDGTLVKFTSVYVNGIPIVFFALLVRDRAFKLAAENIYCAIVIHIAPEGAAVYKRSAAACQRAGDGARFSLAAVFDIQRSVEVNVVIALQKSLV